MPLPGAYEPISRTQTSDHVELFESSGGTRGRAMRGRPVIILRTVGATSGKPR